MISLAPYKGEIISFLGSTCFAFNMIAVVKGRGSRHGDDGVMLSVVATAVIAGFVWVALGASFPTGLTSSAFWIAFAWFAVSGILSTGVTRSFGYAATGTLGVVRASAVSRTNPFFSAALAWIFLGEAIPLNAAFGMVLIGGSFGYLTYLAFRANRMSSGASEPPMIGYLFGLGSSLALAAGFITRRFGLAELSDGVFGAFVGASCAILYQTLTALWSPRTLYTIRNFRSEITGWRLFAGIATSCGQLLIFWALEFTPVAKVVMINALSTFTAMYLSIGLFRTEPWPGWATISATLVASVGVILIAAA